MESGPFSHVECRIRSSEVYIGDHPWTVCRSTGYTVTMITEWRAERELEMSRKITRETKRSRQYYRIQGGRKESQE